MSSSIGTDWPEHSHASALAATTKLLINRPAYLTRVIENATISGETVTRSVSLEASSGPGPHFVPVGSIARDKLVDLLTISPSPDSAATLVGRDETALFSKLILELQCEALDVDPTLPFVDAVTSVSGAPPEDSKAWLTVLERLATVPVAQLPPDDAQQRALWVLAHDQTFLTLFRYFRRFRPLWIPASPKNRSFTVNFSFETGRHEYSVSSVRELVRTIFGLSSYDLVFPISDALRAKTYHFRLRAPQNHYVSHCQVLSAQGILGSDGAIGDLRATRLYQPKAPAFAQYWPQDPDGLAHVYLGEVHLDPEKPSGIFVRVRFAERPFGQLGAALWRWAMVDSFLLAVVTLGPRLVETQSTVGVSVLLAIPAVLGVSTLTTASLGALNTPSGARIASILSGVAALVGAMSLVAWSSSYAACKTSSDASCKTKAPPGVHAVLQTVFISAATLTSYCVVAVAISFNAYRLAKKRRRARSATPKVKRRLTTLGKRS